ncbi:hypothetical protein LAZ67_2001973 [Cordylochernes scorpioides]|uniref:TIR domain-containing protein n=1 Tax=Cordylochernes scorpioides TaxID=51811 RepID=A0ABY6K2F5_9ARAC|nr:hypothetical protein LAZ67_2001973 [Cordylochernes scorpioides]
MFPWQFHPKSSYVVVSVHPNDEKYAEFLKAALSPKYEVWLSTDSIEAMASPIASTPDTPLQPNLPHLDFSRLTAVDSQESQCDVKPLKLFQDRANRANYVILILSSNYCDSKVSIKQAFYCDFRTKMIGIQIEEFETPVWAKKFLGNRIIKDLDSTLNIDALFQTLQEDKRDEVDCLLKNDITCFNRRFRGKISRSVYVTGAADIEVSKNLEVCMKIGQKLAEISALKLVIGGNNDVCHHVAKGFSMVRGNSEKHQLYRMLPIEEKNMVKSLNFKCHDIYLEEKKYTVSSLFHICILIGKDKVSVREACEFYWWDKIIIPITLIQKQSSMTSCGFSINNLCNVSCHPQFCLVDNPNVDPESIGNYVKTKVETHLPSLPTTNGVTRPSPP